MSGKLINTIIYIISILSVFFIYEVPCIAESNHSSIVLDSNWQYFPGNSQYNLDPQLLDILNTKDNQWDTLKIDSTLPSGEIVFLWFRIKLPETDFGSPTLSGNLKTKYFEVYIDDSIIFKSGTISELSNTRYISKNQLVPLPAKSEGKILYIKLVPNKEFLVSDIMNLEILPYDTYLSNQIKSKISMFTFGIILIFLGIFNLVLLFFAGKKDYIYISSFSFICFNTGFLLIFGSPMIYLYRLPGIHIYYINWFNFYLLPVGVFVFISHYMEGRAKKILYIESLIFLISAIILTILDIYDVVIMKTFRIPFALFYIFNVVMCFIGIKKKNPIVPLEIRIMQIGGILYAVFGLTDIIRVSFFSVNFLNNDVKPIHHFGLFAFIISCIISMGFRYFDTHEKLVVFSNNLAKADIEIHEGYIQTVTALASSIEAKDKYTLGHCQRIAEYAIKVAEKLNLSEKEVLNLKYSALLHDIGKIGIDTSILNKPSTLTEDEYNEIQRHPVIAYNILKSVTFLERSLVGIYQHHEYYNGEGYPKGLQQNEISLSGRILCVIDAFDAMTSDRPYRKAMDKEAALLEIKKNIGIQFDPQIAEIFIEIVNDESNQVIETNYSLQA